MNSFEAASNGQRIAFGHSFPGTILPMEIVGKSLICQKRSFLACTDGVNFDIAFQKKLCSGFFDGEGLFLTTLTGPGRVWLQSMSIQRLASELYPYLPKPSNNRN